jgi:hypothetical protein
MFHGCYQKQLQLSSLYEVRQEGLMTTHQPDHGPLEAILIERIANRLLSWLLMMCLACPAALVVMLALAGSTFG